MIQQPVIDRPVDSQPETPDPEPRGKDVTQTCWASFPEADEEFRQVIRGNAQVQPTERSAMTPSEQRPIAIIDTNILSYGMQGAALLHLPTRACWRTTMCGSPSSRPLNYILERRSVAGLNADG